MSAPESPSVELRGASFEHFGRVSGTLSRGRYTLFDPRPEALDELVAALIGLAEPPRGRVTVSGRRPSRSPSVRRRIGSLLGREPWPPRAERTETIRSYVRDVLLARRDTRDPHTLLAELGLGAWLERPTRQLGQDDARTLALRLALSTPDPVLVALHEPLLGSVGSELDPELTRLAETAVVISATSSPRHAQLLGGTLVAVDRGRLVTPGQELAHSLGASAANIRVETPRARELVGALTGERHRPPESTTEHAAPESHIGGVRWDGWYSPNLVLVQGHPAREAVLEVLGAAQREGLPIEALSVTTVRPLAPPVPPAPPAVERGP